MAARAVGEVLGVTMRPAAPSENPATLREPLEAIARASHLRLRRVRLSDAWWQHDCGPLLAYTREDHRPVALLPIAATRYVLFDPLAPHTHPGPGASGSHAGAAGVHVLPALAPARLCAGSIC